jgi:flotillin
MAKLFESMKEATGVDLSEIMKADTYDAKVTKNLNITGIPDYVAASDVAKAVLAVETGNEIKDEPDESDKPLNEK